MYFPADDIAWAEVAAFLRERMAPDARLVAPDPFRFAFPRALRFGQLRQDGPQDLDWVVVHKGELGRIPRAFLLGLPDAAVPVFANTVFVVYATAPAAGLSDLTQSEHVRVLLRALQSLPAEPPPALGAVMALRLPDQLGSTASIRGTRPARPRREPAARPARPWLDGPAGLGTVPGTAREAAFQAEIDWLIADALGTGAGLAVLDIGCGGGRLAPILTDAREVVGVDTDPDALARAALRHAALPGFAFARMDAARLGFPDGVFDAAVMLDLLDLLPDPAAALAEAARVLAPGGRLLVNATNKDALPLLALRRLALPVPRGGVSVQELTGMLRAAGLRPMRIDGIMLAFGWALPGANSSLAPLEEDAEFVAAMRSLGRACGPEHALGIAMLAVKD